MMNIAKQYTDTLKLSQKEREEVAYVIEGYRAEIERLSRELAAYQNPKNWTRPYNYKGELINEHALYRPKLKDS